MARNTVLNRMKEANTRGCFLSHGSTATVVSRNYYYSKPSLLMVVIHAHTVSQHKIGEHIENTKQDYRAFVHIENPFD